MNKPVMIVIVGPSGVGKTSVAQELLKLHKDIRYSISVTTRKLRKNELDGRDYYFLDVSTFKRWIKEDRFYEWAVVYGDYYGTPREPVDELLDKGYSVILDLDIQGALTMKSKREDVVTIFLSPPSIEELKKRLIERGDGMDTINRRIKEVEREMNEIGRFDWTVRNESLKDAVREVSAIIVKQGKLVG